MYKFAKYWLSKTTLKVCCTVCSAGYGAREAQGQVSYLVTKQLFLTGPHLVSFSLHQGPKANGELQTTATDRLGLYTCIFNYLQKKKKLDSSEIIVRTWISFWLDRCNDQNGPE